MAATQCPNPECKRTVSLELVDISRGLTAGGSRFIPGDMVARCRFCGTAVGVIAARDPEIVKRLDKIMKIVEGLQRR